MREIVQTHASHIVAILPSKMFQSETANRRKRQKKATACLACQLRKSRCDLITLEGCHRCRVLRLECSFHADTVSQNHDQSLAGEEQLLGADVETRHSRDGSELSVNNRILQEVSERTKTMMGMLSGIFQNLQPGAMSIGLMRKINGRAERSARSMGGAAHVAYALHLEEPWSLADPVTLGAISKHSLEETITLLVTASSLYMLD